MKEPYKYEQLVNKITSLREDIDKFYKKSNNSAGVRVRKSLQEIKDLSQQIRLEVTEIKKERL